MREQYTVLQNLLETGGESFNDAVPLVNRTSSYIDELALKNAKEFKQAKALLEETFDVIVGNIQCPGSR